jgi:hypothetical protein
MGGYLIDTKNFHFIHNIMIFILKQYDYITRNNHLAIPELHSLLGYKKTKRLWYNESVP